MCSTRKPSEKDKKHYGKGWWLASMVCDHPQCKKQTEWALNKFYEANGIKRPSGRVSEH